MVVLGRMLHFLSGEFLLKNRSNSGSVVFGRSFLVAIFVYALAIILKVMIDPSTGWHFSLFNLRTEVAASIPWFGAIFAGVYVSLYTRFASQWGYLAGLYNEIMAVSSQNPDVLQAEAAMHIWQAGFIEDADDLHLSQQPLFAAVIQHLLKKPQVAANFASFSGGNGRLTRVREKTDAALRRRN